MTGWSESEVIGQPGALVFTPEDRAAGIPEREIAAARANGRALNERWHIRKDNSRFWGSGTVTPVYGPGKTLQGYVKIMRDNTERRRNDERLREALQKAEALQSSAESANRAKDEFIATVSHELRTPLNTIRLWSGMLASGRLPEREAAEGIRMIERAALSQQQLIDDLLDVSSMATGKVRLQIRPTRINDAIGAAVDAVRPTAVARGVTLDAELSPAVGTVRADPDRIQQIVWNLLTNAVKFTEAGGNVRVRVSRSDTFVEIRVIDSGIGISPEALAHVFDRFWQAQSATTRTHRGLGLGLAIVRQLVELHGGEIGAQSEGEGRGATFTVRLPLREQRAAISQLAASSEAAIGSIDITDVDVLLVEDDSLSAEATQCLLESNGARVRVVPSVEAARKAIAGRPPVVLLTDIGLPGESGLSLVRGLRTVESGRVDGRIPAIAISAFARDDDRQQALDAGFDEYLPKPVESDRLLAAIAGLTSRNLRTA
jgi:PAS domain S-box-containing protein